MSAYRLELARIADAARLAVLSQQLIELGLRPTWSAARIGWQIRHPESVVLVAREASTNADFQTSRLLDGDSGSAGGRDIAIGFAIMRYADETAHLNLLAVDPAHQCRGVARSLVEWLEATALTAGTFTVSLELRAGNDVARRFYAGLGYREVERVSGYYQGKEPAIRMVHDLRHPARSSSDSTRPG